MAKRKKVSANIIGGWAFTIALILAIVAGLVQPQGADWVTWVLLLAGLVVGLLNITAKEVVTFLVAAIALIASSQWLSILNALGPYVQAVFTNIVIFVALAALVVSLKAVYAVAATR